MNVETQTWKALYCARSGDEDPVAHACWRPPGLRACWLQETSVEEGQENDVAGKGCDLSGRIHTLLLETVLWMGCYVYQPPATLRLSVT